MRAYPDMLIVTGGCVGVGVVGSPVGACVGSVLGDLVGFWVGFWVVGVEQRESPAGKVQAPVTVHVKLTVSN